MLSLLKSYNIKPIIVLDGKRLNYKEKTDQKRREIKNGYKEKAQ